MKTFVLPDSLGTAAELQKALRNEVCLEGSAEHLEALVALDASHPTRFSKHQGDSVAAAVGWSHSLGQVREVAYSRMEAKSLFPYVPGYLSFREIPVYLAALANLQTPPQLLLVDGQGIAHPRGFGIACHLGVHCGIAAVGVAKTLLYGRLEAELPNEAGSAVRLIGAKGQIGWVYRSRSKVKPLYISPGHLIGMGECLELVRSLPSPTRLLEPLRQAHLEAGRLRRETP